MVLKQISDTILAVVCSQTSLIENNPCVIYLYPPISTHLCVYIIAFECNLYIIMTIICFGFVFVCA